MSPDEDPPLPQPSLQHWHTLIASAAASDEPYATVPVESLMDLLTYASNASQVLHEEGLKGVVSSETDADVRRIGRHLSVVREEES